MSPRNPDQIMLVPIAYSIDVLNKYKSYLERFHFNYTVGDMHRIYDIEAKEMKLIGYISCEMTNDQIDKFVNHFNDTRYVKSTKNVESDYTVSDIEK